MSQIIELSCPLSREAAARLRAGDVVRLTGVIFSARDAAHKRICAALEAGEAPPFPLEGAVIYYMGPSPALPGHVIGAAGPTTSYRMDAYAPLLLERGALGMIGKGARSAAVKESICRFGGVYFAAVGGAGALLSRCIRSAEVVAYPDLGAEAVRRLEIADFPAVVVNDCAGGDWYEAGRAAYLAGRQNA